MINFEQVEQFSSKLTPQWIAGFFDGEGSITVTKDLSLQVVISQSNETILLAIAKHFGFGTVSKASPRKGHEYKIAYTLRWCGQKAANVLTQIKEYLILKQHRAELAIQLQSLVVHAHAGKPVPQENREQREVLAAEIKNINDSHWSRRPKTEQYQNGMVN